MPNGLKAVRRTLATGEVRTYWYHRATGERLDADPTTPKGTAAVAALDRKAGVVENLANAPRGSYAELWRAYRGDPRAPAEGDRMGSPEWRALKPRTRSDYQAVRDWLGDKAAERMPLAKITTGQVFKLRDKAAGAKGRRFGNYVVQVLRLTLEWGRKRDFLKVNPAMDVDLIRKPRGEAVTNRPWTADELEAFVTDCPLHLLIPFALGLFAGMREGDALTVTRRAYEGSAVRWIASKNGEAGMAPATGPLKAVLDAALDWAKAERFNAVQLALTSRGTPWTESGFRASFFKRVRKLREAGAIGPNATFHGLRHTIATIARNDGESDSRTAAAIGDRSSATANIYGRAADRGAAQSAILEGVQKRFGNIDWKTPADDWKTRPISPPRKGVKS